MIEISLTRGQVTLVDDIDADLAELKWQADPATTYADTTFTAKRGEHVNGKQKPIYLHRVIMARILDRPLVTGECVDHKNHNPLDNRRENLRLATRTQNSQNIRRRKASIYNFKGVILCENTNRWRARITVFKKTIHLGYFDTEIEAARAYDNAAKEHFGEFASLNFQD